jgi:hypothetical protein
MFPPEDLAHRVEPDAQTQMSPNCKEQRVQEARVIESKGTRDNMVQTCRPADLQTCRPADIDQ